MDYETKYEIDAAKKFKETYAKVETILKENKYYPVYRSDHCSNIDRVSEEDKKRAFLVWLLSTLNELDGITPENVYQNIIFDSKEYGIDAITSIDDHTIIYVVDYYDYVVPSNEVKKIEKIWHLIRDAKEGKNVFSKASEEFKEKFLSHLNEIAEPGNQTTIFYWTSSDFTDGDAEYISNIAKEIDKYYGDNDPDIGRLSLRPVNYIEIDVQLNKLQSKKEK